MRLPTYFRFLLIVMGLIYLARTAAYMSSLLSEANGLVHADGFNPVGGDYINLFAAARLVLEGRAGEIYVPELFGAFEQTLIGTFSGIGVWVYPPPSLLLIWPFGLVGYIPGLLIWSVLGLVAMALGAWRAGFRPIEILILLLAPATISCVVVGQTSNLFLALLLIAISARDGGRPAGGLAAGFLTIKPQLGFTLPVIFLLRRQWLTIAVATLCALILAGISAAIFGPEAWRSYVVDSLSFLTEAERTTTGPFMLIEPSVFMAGRILTGDAGLAYVIHGIVAALALAYALWRLIGARTQDQQASIALAVTALVAPYFHTYDAGLVLCAALLAARQWEPAGGVARLLGYFVVIGAWVLPDLTQILNGAGVPAGPLLMIAVLLLAGEAPKREGSLQSP
jgi:alpha-1,2-mannosyltransferase